MTELLPCPFCGGEAKMRGSIMDGYWVGCCGKCFACTQRYKTEAEAIEAWNTRAERTCKDAYAWDGRHEFGKCSECGEQWGLSYPNYCPNCGAKVVEE